MRPPIEMVQGILICPVIMRKNTRVISSYINHLVGDDYAKELELKF